MIGPIAFSDAPAWLHFGLKKVCDRCRSDFAKARAAIESGEWDVYEYVDVPGFAAVQLVDETLVVQAWYLSPDHGGKDVRTAASGQLEQLGARLGATSLIFSSPRAGWAREAPRLGFSEISTVWSKDIT